MKISKKQIERHRQDWNRFVHATTWTTVGIAAILVTLKILLV